MNDQTSWHPSLVKKFSSSNHYKLLNQLRNEVIRYPLNNKKQTALNQIKNINKDNKYKSNISHSQNYTETKNSTNTQELETNESTVSFNNAKDFSIYNNNFDNHQNENLSITRKKSNEELSSPTFKDRLNQIEMK